MLNYCLSINKLLAENDKFYSLVRCLYCMQLDCTHCQKILFSCPEEQFSELGVQSCSCCGKTIEISPDGQIKTIKRPIPYIWLTVISVAISLLNSNYSTGINFLSVICLWFVFLCPLLSAIHHKVVLFRPNIYLNNSEISLFDNVTSKIIIFTYFVPTVGIPLGVIYKLSNT
jgi:hypothetical protein